MHTDYSDDPIWCETCDRGFRSSDLLQQHKQQHEKCTIDGCRFVAHPKVITKHIQMQHSTGLFQEIANLKNPEDIQKWREERKKKYPTKDNVTKNYLNNKGKLKIGENIHIKQIKGKQIIGKLPKRKFSNKTKKKCGIHCKITSQNEHNIRNKRKKKYNSIPVPRNKRNLKPFSGILDLTTESGSETVLEPEQFNFVIDDDEEDCIQDPKIKIDITSKIIQLSVCGALSSLMCVYRSSEEESELNKKKASTEKNICEINETGNERKHESSNAIFFSASILKTVKIPKKGLKFDRQENYEDRGPEEVEVEKEVMSHILNDMKIGKKYDYSYTQKNDPHIKTKSSIKQPKPKVPSTLIYKLLNNKIRQERKIVLQCLKHIVNNNFFVTLHN